MKNVLITGGTVFVSKYIAEYFSKKDEYEVFVLNRNNHSQPKNTHLIKCDKSKIENRLRDLFFDIVIDVNSYTEQDVKNVVKALNKQCLYIFISSSAVYPENTPQPFKESYRTGYNNYWKQYGINKIEAETYLLTEMSDIYIIRPPYLYGPLNNVYRESFVFECAEKNREFYLPNKGELKLQFFFIEDLCKVIESIIELRPKDNIFNVGNNDSISVYDWVKLCYEIVGKKLEVINVTKDIDQRLYFCFYDYEYKLDVSGQNILLVKTKSIGEGLIESYNWYKNNRNEVNRKNYIEYIDRNLI